jgi:hypothetical protein
MGDGFCKGIIVFYGCHGFYYKTSLLIDLGALTSLLLPLTVGCSRFFANSTFADNLINDRPINYLRPIFHALIATILPLDDEVFAEFPLSYYENLIVREFSL